MGPDIEGLTAVELFCHRRGESSSDEASITSLQRNKGSWSHKLSCPDSQAIVGFKAWGKKPKWGLGNLIAVCGGGDDDETELLQYTDEKEQEFIALEVVETYDGGRCPEGYLVCAVKTWTHEGTGNMKGLVGMLVKCCAV